MNYHPSYLIPLIAASLLSQGSLSAAPLVSIGDSADIFFNGSSSVRWASNVYRDEDDEVDDIIWTFSPGFEVNVGRGVSNADLSIITRYDIVRYDSESKNDTELFHIKAIGSYKTSRLDLNGSVSFDENKTTSGDNNVVDDLIEFDDFRASLNSEYRFYPKFSFGAGVSYSETEYKTYDDILADRETVSVPLDIFYELTPKVNLSLGYTYTNTDVEDTDRVVPVGLFGLANVNVGDYETGSHFFNVGARGNLLPKLTGFFKIGYRVRESDNSTITTTPLNIFAPPASVSKTNRNDNGMLGLDADLTWAATPKLTTSLGLSRNFGVGGEGQATENSSFDLVTSYSINSYFAASASLGYTLRDYSDGDREDNQYDAGVRLSYSPNQHWRFSTGYTYVEYDSETIDRSYTSHMFDLSVLLRY